MQHHFFYWSRVVHCEKKAQRDKINGIFLTFLKKKTNIFSGVRIALLSLVLLAFTTGCSNTAPVKNPNIPVTPPAQNTVKNAEKSIGLSPENFPGLLSIHAGSMTKTEKGFTLPVFLSNVTEEQGLDTIALQFALTGEERLTQVQTTSGFTAQLDNLNTNKPTVYYLPSALSADAYKPVVAQKDPLFTLYFEGEVPDSINIKGSFFVISGTIYRTNTATLQLK